MAEIAEVKKQSKEQNVTLNQVSIMLT